MLGSFHQLAFHYFLLLIADFIKNYFQDFVVVNDDSNINGILLFNPNKCFDIAVSYDPINSKQFNLN